MSLGEYTLLAFSSLFAIVDPIALIPAFLAMTPRDPPRYRERMARLACIVAAGVLVFFTLTGEWIFRLLGVTLPAFQIAGSIVLLYVALDMVQAKRSAVQESTQETKAGTIKEDIAITPLAVPLLAGPGAITTSLILLNQAEGIVQKIALNASIILVLLVSYVVLRLSVRGARWLSPIALTILSRLMGLLLAAIAVQFIINALIQLGVIQSSS